MYSVYYKYMTTGNESFIPGHTFIIDILEVPGKNVVKTFIDDIKRRMESRSIKHRIRILSVSKKTHTDDTLPEHIKNIDKYDEPIDKDESSNQSNTFPYNLFNIAADAITTRDKEERPKRKSFFDGLFSSAPASVNVAIKPANESSETLSVTIPTNIEFSEINDIDIESTNINGIVRLEITIDENEKRLILWKGLYDIVERII